MANPPLRQGDAVWVGRRMLVKGSDAIVAVGELVNGLVKIWILFQLINTQ